MNKSTKQILLLPVLILAFVLIMYLLAIGSVKGLVMLGLDPCANELIQSATSENGELIAEVNIRNCGATTDYVQVVTINDSTVLFIDHYSGQKVELEWQGNENLLIRYPNDLNKSDTLKTNYKGVQIQVIK